MLIALLPGVLALISAAIWSVFAVRARDLRYLRTHFVATVLVLLFLIHPTLIKVMFSTFSCGVLEEGEKWLNDNLAIKCWEGDHLQYSILVALPSIIVWGIAAPAACLFALARYRSSLDTYEVRLRFGFLFNGYRPQTFYWEFVILYRKILVICCSVFLGQYSVEI
jgi:hypothetical protein